MHRIKRPRLTGDGFIVSHVQQRTSHENIGKEPKAETKTSPNQHPGFQLNSAGGPLGEEYIK